MASIASICACAVCLLLLELLLLGGLELGVLDLWNSRWTCFQGRRWSAMIIQTIDSSIAIEEIAKTTCSVGWLR